MCSRGQQESADWVRSGNDGRSMRRRRSHLQRAHSVASTPVPPPVACCASHVRQSHSMLHTISTRTLRPHAVTSVLHDALYVVL
jgi:hypothetical protein